jgi:hypothetical protein
MAGVFANQSKHYARVLNQLPRCRLDGARPSGSRICAGSRGCRANPALHVQRAVRQVGGATLEAAAASRCTARFSSPRRCGCGHYRHRRGLGQQAKRSLPVSPAGVGTAPATPTKVGFERRRSRVLSLRNFVWPASRYRSITRLILEPSTSRLIVLPRPRHSALHILKINPVIGFENELESAGLL